MRQPTRADWRLKQPVAEESYTLEDHCAARRARCAYRRAGVGAGTGSALGVTRPTGETYRSVCRMHPTRMPAGTCYNRSGITIAASIGGVAGKALREQILALKFEIRVLAAHWMT